MTEADFKKLQARVMVGVWVATGVLVAAALAFSVFEALT